MLEVIFDAETDGFKATKTHSIAAIILDSGEKFSFADQPGFVPITSALELLSVADVVIGHNVKAFDLRVLRKLYRFELKPGAQIYDTLIAARLLWPDPSDADADAGIVPARLIGKHSLEAWGYRLGMLKGDFGKTTDWRSWSPQMQSYCEQDVAVTAALHRHILAQSA